MAAFLKAVEKFSAKLHTFLIEKGHENDIRLCTWSYVAIKIAQILQKYPTGLTEAVILSELLTGLNDHHGYRNSTKRNQGNRGFPTEEKCGGIISVLDILETKQANASACIECYMKPVSDEHQSNVGSTRIVRLIDKETSDHTFCDGAGIPSVEMYLHQKICCVEEHFFKYPLMMTNLRIHKMHKQGRHDIRLLPTEFVVPILDSMKDKQFISEKFGALDGIMEEDAFPHYTRNVLVRIDGIGPRETINNPYGDIISKTVIKLRDLKENIICLILWDEAITFVNLFSLGDTLCIEEPFYVKEDGAPHLEYGPATIFYTIPACLSTEIISSQARKCDMSSVRRATDGKLDFYSYPHQLVSTDLKKNSINVTFVGVLKMLSPKVFFQDDMLKEHQFKIELHDEYGTIRVHVHDDSLQLHETLCTGQILLIENMQVDDFSCCTVKPFHMGSISNISALRGYAASPCMYSLQDINNRKDGNFVVHGTVRALKPANSAYTKQAHLTCLGFLKEDRQKRLFCPRCKCDTSPVANSLEKMAFEEMSKQWKWIYHVTISITESKSNKSLDLQISDNACKEMLGISAEDFSKREEYAVETIIDGIIGKSCVFSVSEVEHVMRVDAFEITTESFLDNFKTSH